MRSNVLVDNADGMLLRNQIKILQYLQRAGMVARTELAAHTGLTQAAVSKITALLIATGIVEEACLMTGKLGRRSIGLRITANGRKVIAIKLSRRNYSIGVFSLSGEAVEQHRKPIPVGQSYDAAFDEIRETVLSYIENYGDIAAIGVSVPGPFLMQQNKILLISEQGVDARRDIDLSKVFCSQEMGGKPVIISHDANAGVLAYWWFGIEERILTGTVVHYLLGEGVGAGVIVDGRVFTGELGTSAEIGHVSVDSSGIRCSCGNYGCLELYSSSLAFVQDAKRKAKEDPSSVLAGKDDITPASIFQAAQEGDNAAISCVDRAAHYIGLGLVNIINCYNPTTIILCNEMAVGGEYLLQKVKDVAKARLIPYLYENVEVCVSKFPGDDILFGAAAVAIDYCLKNPSSLANGSFSIK